jgi:hypothetical protein
VSNFLRGERRDAVEAYLRAGYPSRWIERVAGVHRDTVLSIRAGLEAQGVAMQCPCGQSSQHQGFCAARLAIYPGRRAWLARTWGKQSLADVPTGWHRCYRCGGSLPGDNYHVGQVLHNSACPRLWETRECRRCGYALQSGIKLTIKYHAGCTPWHRNSAQYPKQFTPEQRGGALADLTRNQEKRQWRHGRRLMQAVQRYLLEPSRGA